MYVISLIPNVLLADLYLFVVGTFWKDEHIPTCGHLGSTLATEMKYAVTSVSINGWPGTSSFCVVTDY